EHAESSDHKPIEYQPTYVEKPVEFQPYEYKAFEDKPFEDKSFENKPHYGYVYHDPKDSHNAEVGQDADQFSSMEQESDELIFIKDSCNIVVHTTDTQAAVSLQVALQLAIALVIRITIGDSDQGKAIQQDLLQHFESEQNNKQKICIENSKDINVTTTDTDVAANIQVLLEVLVSLVAKLDVL
ncbi:MAG: spore coat protein, partial [Neobacillus sp.]|nr:spore coat protein [Neobacillus sp.]